MVVAIVYFYAHELPYESIVNQACTCGEECCISTA